MTEPDIPNIKIGIVGPCGAGKTSVSKMLLDRGYNVRQIAQEHSYVKDMWKRISNPDILIYLTVSQPYILQRKGFHFSNADYETQIERLNHARKHADLVIDTDELSIDQVFQEIVGFLSNIRLT